MILSFYFLLGVPMNLSNVRVLLQQAEALALQLQQEIQEPDFALRTYQRIKNIAISLCGSDTVLLLQFLETATNHPLQLAVLFPHVAELEERVAA